MPESPTPGTPPTAAEAPARVVLTGVSSRAWEHPADRAALQALRRVPGFDLVLRKVFGLISERTLRLITVGSAVEVGPRQYAHIDEMYAEILEVLDCPKRFGLYVSQNPVVNAGAVGMDDPFIVLNSGTVQLLTDEQLRVVIAHEVGHILSDHVLYKTMLRMLMRISRLLLSLPLSGLPVLAVVAALLEWDRKSELSADRAALLATQRPDDVRASLLRIAGGVGRGAEIDAFREQAARYEESGSALDSVVKTLALLNRSHPFPVQRLREVDRWIASGGYEAVLDGEYPLRADDRDASAWDAWKESAEAYKDGLKGTTDPLASWMRETGAAAADKAGSVFGWLRRGRSEGEGEHGEGGVADGTPPDGAPPDGAPDGRSPDSSPWDSADAPEDDSVDPEIG